MKKYIGLILMVALIIGFSFIINTNIVSQTEQQSAKMDSISSVTDEVSPVYGITAGRTISIIEFVIGLISIIISLRAKRSNNRIPGSGKTKALAGLTLGMIGIVFSVVHLSIFAGAVFGSGSGKAGAIVALVLSLVGVTLSRLALRPVRLAASRN